MAFNFFKWLLKTSTPKSESSEEISSGTFLDENVELLTGLETYIERLAFWSCVRKIGTAVGACEIETYRAGSKVKAREYWSWNYSPNPNQTREQFMTKLIGELYSKQEAIVVETRQGYRYVADGYGVEKHLSGNIYTDITSDGESIKGTFGAADVLRLSLEGTRIRIALNALASADGQLLKSSASSFVRNNGMRGTLSIDDFAEADPDFDETYNDLINDKFKKYFTSENAVLPLFKGYTYTERQSTSGKSAQANTRDIRALMDDIMDLTARGLGIPLSIAQGKNVTDNDFREFMTSTVQPIALMLQQEINRKLYGSRQVLSQGSYVVINPAGVRYKDIFDIANPIDKLIGSGAFCINDIRVRTGEDIIDEPWAWQHYMTKNYSTVEDLNNGLNNDDGTETDEKKEGENNEDKTDDQ